MDRGDYNSLAEVDGEYCGSPAFAVGVDFDPDDEEAVEIVRLATRRHAAEKESREIRRLTGENEALRARLAQLDPDFDL